MPILKKLTTTSLVLSAALMLFATAPAFARQGADDTPETVETTSQSSPTTTTPTTTSTEDASHQTGRTSEPSRRTGSATKAVVKQEDRTAHESSTETEAASGHEVEHPELHTKGADILAKAKESHTEIKTAEQLKQQCEAHKVGLTNKATAIVSRSQAVQSRIDDILAKAKAYKTTSGVQPEGYDALVAAAESAQSASAASVLALQSVKPVIDCTATTPPADVATFKAAVQQARDNLKSYRSSVKAVLQALRSVTPATTTTTGVTQ